MPRYGVLASLAGSGPASGHVLALGGGRRWTFSGRMSVLGGQGWAQSILVPLKSSTRSLKSGSIRSEGRSPSSLAASLSAPREMRYLGCKGQPWLQWRDGLEDASPSPEPWAGALRSTCFFFSWGEGEET